MAQRKDFYRLLSTTEFMISYIKKDLSQQYNIGDDFCTPDKYFKIESENNFCIIGGGAYVDYGLKRLKKLNIDPKKTIAWGLGNSDKKLIDNKVKTLPYLEWALRDLDSVTSNKFVPCVSCFNRQIVSEPKGNNTLIFLNANEKVSGNITISQPFLTNAVSLDDFIRQWSTADKIITNSYHGIYWSLLSGRSVLPFGYSSKFFSVLKMFEKELPQQNYYKIKSKTELNDLLLQSLENPNYISIKNSNLFLDRFRSLNYQFAMGLSQYGIRCSL
jgi:hypothetical protein